MDNLPKRKPFLTVEEQIELLVSRGLLCPAETKNELLVEGYYSIVNGYKTPFIDEEASAKVGDDRFIEGTSFEDIFQLFQFDRKLRQITFEVLLEVEAEVRTLCAYTFAENHDAYSGYLDKTSYIAQEDYQKGDYSENLNKLISIFKSKAERGEREPVVHYREDYGAVPFWILASDMTFGNLEHFFKLMKPEEQRTVCKRIAEATGRLGNKSMGYFDPVMCANSLTTLVKVRNCCAHDERLYCKRFGKNGDDYSDFLKRLVRFVSAKRYESFTGELRSLINRYSEHSEVLNHVLLQMGIPAE